MMVRLLEFFKLIRKHECLRYEVVILLQILLLHSLDINGQTVLPCYLRAQRKMVNFLSRIESLVEISLALRVRP